MPSPFLDSTSWCSICKHYYPEVGPHQPCPDRSHTLQSKPICGNIGCKFYDPQAELPDGTSCWCGQCTWTNTTSGDVSVTLTPGTCLRCLNPAVAGYTLCEYHIGVAALEQRDLSTLASALHLTPEDSKKLQNLADFDKNIEFVRPQKSSSLTYCVVCGIVLPIEGSRFCSARCHDIDKGVVFCTVCHSAPCDGKSNFCSQDCHSAHTLGYETSGTVLSVGAWLAQRNRAWLKPHLLQPVEVFTASTGAIRSTEADGIRYDLIPQLGLERVAQTCYEGAKKYSPNNWKKGFNWSTMMNHAQIHLAQYLKGDTSEDHLAHACWNLLALMDYETIFPQGNDLCQPTSSPSQKDQVVTSEWSPPIVL